MIVLGLRQIMEALAALPSPPNAIWHYPGFPSLLVTYGVANEIIKQFAALVMWFFTYNAKLSLVVPRLVR